MFQHFIYIIVALLIFLTYPSPTASNFSIFDSLLMFFGIKLFFALTVAAQFKRLERAALMVSPGTSLSNLDMAFDKAVDRQSVVALMLYATDIYFLNLPVFAKTIPYISRFETLIAAFFLALFIAHLVIIWAVSYKAYQAIYKSDFTRKSYILSNISMRVPMLLPWLAISTITDLISLIPFVPVRVFLESPFGQTIYIVTIISVAILTAPLIIQKFWNCRPLENNFARSRIEELCKDAGVGYRDILYWPIFGGRMITAGVMGVVARFRYILVTDALFEYLNQDEVDCVIAHEIGHVKKYHLIFYLAIFISFQIILLSMHLDKTAVFMLLAQPFLPFSPDSNFLITYYSQIFLFILCFVLYFRYVFGYFMRNFERQADTYVYSLFNSGVPLITTFEKIVTASGMDPAKPNWHHFSIKERVDFIRECEHDRSRIKAHDRKLNKSIAAFVITIVGFVCALNFFYYSGRTERLLETLMESAYIAQAKKKPNEATPLLYLGSYYFDKKEYEKAGATLEKALLIMEPKNVEVVTLAGQAFFETKNYFKAEKYIKTALAMTPGNPELINSLAWLYATSEDSTYFRPKAALPLAQKAARLSPSSHILDTLAEAFFVNGMYRKAYEIEKKILTMRLVHNRDHYVKQAEKYKAAADRIGIELD